MKTYLAAPTIESAARASAELIKAGDIITSDLLDADRMVIVMADGWARDKKIFSDADLAEAQGIVVFWMNSLTLDIRASR